jgi:hypothetical protein
MAGGLKQEMVACRHCGYADLTESGNFRKEERMAYREVGDKGSHNYSREMFLYQFVLVCVACGRVHEVLDRP